MNDPHPAQPADLSAEGTSDRPSVRLPGRGFAIFLAVLTLLQLYSVSLPGRADWHLLLLLVWGVTGLVWLVWLFAIVIGSKDEWLQGVWRFSAIAVSVLVLIAVSQSDALIRLRFELSRPAFEAALADVPFGSGMNPSDRMIGLYHIRWAYPADGGILFEIAGTGGGFFVGGGGFLWTDDASQVNYNHEPLGGQWYSWVDRW